MMEIRRHNVVVEFPFLRDYTAVLLAGLVIEYLEVYLVATLLKEGHDSLAGHDMM